MSPCYSVLNLAPASEVWPTGNYLSISIIFQLCYRWESWPCHHCHESLTTPPRTNFTYQWGRIIIKCRHVWVSCYEMLDIFISTDQSWNDQCITTEMLTTLHYCDTTAGTLCRIPRYRYEIRKPLCAPLWNAALPPSLLTSVFYNISYL